MNPVTAALKALANPNRRAVYQVICRAWKSRREGITIERICRATRMKQPAVSHHVSGLTAAGLIERRKSRWWVYCTPARNGLDALSKFLRNPGAFPRGEGKRKARVSR